LNTVDKDCAFIESSDFVNLFVVSEEDIKLKLRCVGVSVSCSNIDLGVRYGVHQSIGLRPYMEDRIYANANLSGMCFITMKLLALQ
jgi:hypothetical protein